INWYSDSLSFSAQPFSSLYSFSNDDDMKNWDYTYSSIGSSLIINGHSYNDVINVTGIQDINVADTVDVINNKAVISDTSKTVYLRGTASGTIIITALPPKSSGNLTIYNRSNWSAKLGTIDIPVDGGKSFEYVSGNWTYGFKDIFGVRRDTTYTDLPFGSKNIMKDSYAKNIGLVDQEFVMWEYQFSNSLQSGYSNGFGVKRSIIDHN
ncbi:MAG TPA: hypothetical protein VK173_00995, partial [Lacibacter sp.]|nr:hypothetical protein [Lacibacter sp.]